MKMCDGRVALVTGGAGNGMGRSIALTLAREGAKIVLNYRRSEAQAAEIVSYLHRQGVEAVSVQGDVFLKDDCQRIVKVACDRFARVDICVVGPGAGWHPKAPESLDPTLAVEDVCHEITPLFNLMPLCLPAMYERQWGRLIAIGLCPPYGSPSYSYNVGKAARAQALKLASHYAWPHGVTVNVLGPGPVAEGGSLEEAIAKCQQGPAWRNRQEILPQDVAEGVAFLCSECGRFITGCELPYGER